MTKRFIAIPETVTYIDNITGEVYCPKYETDFYRVEDKLNELNDENQYIKTVIKEAYEHERTKMGKSVLKQLMERLNL